MEFRLLYEGKLKTSAGASEKHEVRRRFHPQLRRLWNIKDNLRELARNYGSRALESHLPEPIDWFVLGITEIGRTFNCGGHPFVPLVTRDMGLRCSLDILLLRPEEDRFTFTSGDIDGQLKTLFDALRIPKTMDEAGGMPPQEDESPFFCLLEDDKLISEINVIADQLLLLPHEREARASDAFAVVHVKINPKSPGTFDRFF